MDGRRRLAFGLSLVRGYASKYPRPKPGTSERPAYHPRDPLVNNPKAVVVPLADENLTFIHRPPPTAPSPISLTTSPISALLRPPTATQDVPLPPLLRRTPEKEETPVSKKAILKMQQLRASNPTVYTGQKLAKMFNCSRGFVTVVTRLKTAQRTAMRKELEAKHAERREKWSERHSIVKAVRKKRRELW